MSRRRSGLWLICLLVVALSGSAGNEPTLDFIHLTDTHVLDLKGVDPRLVAAREHFRPSAETLPAFLGAAAKYRPSFFLVTGDLIDAFRYADANGRPAYGQVEAFARATQGSPAPFYLALGNHDIAHYSVNVGTDNLEADQSVAEEARAAWTASAECFRKGTYYSFEKRVGATTYLFLVLENAYNSDEIAQEQIHWLRRQAARQDGRVMILAMHIPLEENATSRAIRSAVAHARVSLVLAGHRHSDRIEEIAAGSGNIVQVQTAAFGYGEKNWRKIRLRGDRIEVFVTGDPERLEKTIAFAAAGMTPY